MIVAFLANLALRELPAPLRLLTRLAYRSVRGLISYPIWMFRWISFRILGQGDHTLRVGIHTVFIPKENILFLKEWILYHKWKGVEHFFLYDNTGTEGYGEGIRRPHFERRKANKYGIPYADIVALSDAEIIDILDHIQHEIPNIHIVKWQPTDSEGRIKYAQVEAQNDALKRFAGTVDWMVFMDMDEFLVSSEPIPVVARQLESGGYDGGFIYDMVMTSRYDHLDRYVTHTTLAFRKPFPSAPKYLCKISRTWYVMVHRFISLGRRYTFTERELFFLHYKLPSSHPDMHDHFEELDNPIAPQWLDTLYHSSLMTPCDDRGTFEYHCSLRANFLHGHISPNWY